MTTAAVLKHLIHVFKAGEKPEAPLKLSKLEVFCLETSYWI